MIVYGSEGGNATLQLRADEGDDAADKYRIISQSSDNTLRIQDIPDGGTWEDKIVFNNNQGLELYHNDEKMFATNNDGGEFFDSDNNFNLYFNCNGTRRGYLFVDATGGGKMAFMDPQNHPMVEAIKDGSVILYHDNTARLTTSSDGVDFGTGGADDILHISGQTLHRTGNNGCGFHFSSQVVLPTNAAGTTTDNHTSIGNSSYRFQNAHFMQLSVHDRVNSTLKPYSSNTYDLGSTTYRWRNIYTNDLNLSNKGSTNSVDNTWGDYTIQEGESDLFLINNRNGKKYKFNLTEVS